MAVTMWLNAIKCFLKGCRRRERALWNLITQRSPIKLCIRSNRETSVRSCTLQFSQDSQLPPSLLSHDDSIINHLASEVRQGNVSLAVLESLIDDFISEDFAPLRGTSSIFQPYSYFYSHHFDRSEYGSCTRLAWCWDSETAKHCISGQAVSSS